MISVSGSGKGLLFTDPEFSDFELSPEYRLQLGGNSGVYVRAPIRATSPTEAVEIALLDDNSLKGPQRHDSTIHNGALHGLVGPSAAAANPVGQWNS